MPLSAREREVLAFERDWAVQEGHKQQAIRDHFGFTPAYYYQLLSRLLARPEAEAFDPLLVRRLRRRRQQRATQRTGLSEQVGRGGSRPASK